MPPPDLDDLTLRRAALRDPAACRAVVGRYQGLVFAVAARVLGAGSPDLADVAQEAFLKMFAALGRFDPRGPARFPTWLATIATRVAIDHARRRRRTVIPLDAIRDSAAALGGDPGEVLDADRRRARLAAAMAALGPDQRAAMLLRAEHDLSYEAIATALGIEVGTVRSRLARAKAALREAVGERDEAEVIHDRR
jgi:RNA polymerase sigma-70 factor (ECF subfamily)